MASPTQWTWVWVDSGSWWWTGRPGVLWFMESQELDTTEQLNWTELNWTEESEWNIKVAPKALRCSKRGKKSLSFSMAFRFKLIWPPCGLSLSSQLSLPSLFLTPTYHSIPIWQVSMFWSPRHVNKRRKRSKRNPNWKRSVTVCKWHDTQHKNPKDAIRKLLELINDFRKIAGYKIVTQKPIAFLLIDSSNSVQFSSVAQACPTLCDPMNRNKPGLPVHHQLPESTQTHVHRVGDAIQPSHLLLPPSPPALNLSRHKGLFYHSFCFWKSWDFW